jgi:glutathione peroxidase
MTDIYEFTAQAADGSPAPLSAYRGKVLLIVNVASKCGFTPQYEGLEALNRKYADQGLVILGFPCNQFGGQEPGDAAEIASFCNLTYDVTFPVLAKIDVNGPKADPLYEYLTHEKRGLLGSTGIKWNFTKFLVGRDGKVIERFAPADKPKSLEGAVEQALAAA